MDNFDTPVGVGTLAHEGTGAFLVCAGPADHPVYVCASYRRRHGLWALITTVDVSIIPVWRARR